jgi:hypothetical protein
MYSVLFLPLLFLASPVLSQTCEEENNTDQWIHKDARTRLYEVRQELCGGNAKYQNCGGISAQDGSFNNTCFYQHPSDGGIQGVMYGDHASTDKCWVCIPTGFLNSSLKKRK